MFERSAVLLVSIGISTSPLHRDPQGTLLVGLCGVRHVWVAHPDAFTAGKGADAADGITTLPDEDNPALGAAWEGPNKHKFVLRAGDVIYIPVLWWHAVQSECRSTGSMAVAFECSARHEAVPFKVEGVGPTCSIQGWTSARKLLGMLVNIGVSMPDVVRQYGSTRRSPSVSTRLGSSRSPHKNVHRY